MRPTSRSGTRNYLVGWDLVLASLAPGLALWLRDSGVFYYDGQVVAYYWLCSLAVTLLALWGFRLQHSTPRYFSFHDTLDIAEAVLFAELTTFVLLFTLTRLDGIPRSIPLIHGPVLGFGLIVGRILMRGLLSDDEEPKAYRSRPQRIILIGANRLATDFVRMLQGYLPQDRIVVAILDDKPAMVGQTLSGVRVLGAPLELDAIMTEFAVHGVNVDRLMIAGESDLVAPAVLHEIEHVCRKRHIELLFLPRMIGLTQQNLAHAGAAPDPMHLAPVVETGRYIRFKRVLDVVGSTAALLLLCPLILIASLLVMVDVGRPVLFWQERIGWKGRSFLMYKFRTLSAPFDSDGRLASSDRQPSAIGRFLRVTRIDELPQLLNVLLGDMSLIGPRPLLPEDQPENASVRLSVRPGITGLAQVNGAKLLSKELKTEFDNIYVRNASLWMDLQIVAMTFARMLQSRTTSQESLADSEQIQSRHCAMAPNIAAPSVVAPDPPAVDTSEVRS
jgi:lipopolysaccharide/colanic/teichoic acid biosynthesis glycosyltransferase